MKNLDNTMSIKPPRTDMNHSSQTATQVSKGSGVSRGTTDSPPTGSSSDTVTLTNTVAEMAKLEENLALIPDVDNNRVEAIKASIADGTYQVDPEKIVENLLKIEKEFG